MKEMSLTTSTDARNSSKVLYPSRRILKLRAKILLLAGVATFTERCATIVLEKGAKATTDAKNNEISKTTKFIRRTMILSD